jgi:hypothetical protein
MRVDMFGFKQQHKLITSEGMDMIKRQIECDIHNIQESLDNNFKAKYIQGVCKSIREQQYALEKGRFR